MEQLYLQEKPISEEIVSKQVMCANYMNAVACSFNELSHKDIARDNNLIQALLRSPDFTTSLNFKKEYLDLDLSKHGTDAKPEDVNTDVNTDVDVDVNSDSESTSSES